MKHSIIVLLAVVCCLPLFAQVGQPCNPADAAAIDVPPVDGHASCAVEKGEIQCAKNGGYVYTFTVTNHTGSDVTSVLVTPPIGGGFSITPQTPPLPGGVLPDGQSATLQVTITGGVAGQKICFPVTLMTKKGTCCTVEVCVTLPNCCATFSAPKIECKNGSYSYTFTITNNTPNTVQHIYLHAPAGTTITPSYFAVNLAPGATSAPLTVTITGAQPGRYCFGVSLHTAGMKACCTFEQCIELPPCEPQSACANGVCCSRAPRYVETNFTGQKVAAVTGCNYNASQASNFVLTVFDLSGANGFGTNGSAPPPGNLAPLYTGPAAKPWSEKNLGTVFGVDMDHLGNIYVTASSAFNRDTIGPGGPGAVYRIDNGTGAIQTFATLPNTLGPGNQYAALGNIAFDCARKQLFVTNEDDGRIYRINISGSVDSAFDHITSTVTPGGAPEAGDAPGFAPLGERLWGVQVHNNRVYYAVWNEDCGNRNANAAIRNEIWSVGLKINGDFDPATRRRELQVPDIPGSDYSNPTSDIAFARNGNMLLAERTMLDATTTNAHASRVLEFACDPSGRWRLTPSVAGLPYRFNVGVAATSGCPIPTGAQPANAAGGIDYDYDPNATYGVWATGDALTSNLSLYGFQGFPSGGGSVTTSPLLTLYGQGSFKTQIGDIEVSCPPLDNPY